MTTVFSSLDTNNANVLNYYCSEDSKIAFEVAKAMKSIPSCTNTKKSVCANTKKSVCFNPVVHGRAVLHINDYSDEELRSKWYTALEYDAFKVEIWATVLLMTSGGSLILGHGEQYCARGLESATRDGARKKRLNNLHCRRAVIDEQELQNAQGRQCDDQFLAHIYFDCSRHCQYEAHEKALALRALLDQRMYEYAAAAQINDDESSCSSVKTIDLSPESRRREQGSRLQSSATQTMISTAAA
jgi:hypothetical protein